MSISGTLPALCVGHGKPLDAMQQNSFTAGVLYPLFWVFLSTIIAGAAMSLSPVSVIMNALRLRKISRVRYWGTER